MKTIKQIKQGCGERDVNNVRYKCGYYDWLCPTCQALLKQMEGVVKFLYNEQELDKGCTCENCLITRCLINKLKGEDGE